MRPTALTVSQARRIAISASGFGRRPGARTPGRRALAATVASLGAVQIDSVNVLTRAHYLPLFSRLGPYDRAELDAASSRAPRALFEYWGHEASLLPVTAHPLLRWRMDRVHDDAWGGMVRVQREHPGFVAEVAALVRETGPVTITELESELEHDRDRPRSGWGWNWSMVKRAVEYLFWAGEISSAGRDSTFRRRYAAVEAVIPRAVLDVSTPDPATARRELLAWSARALGVGTAGDLADYFRLSRADAAVAIAELVEAGRLCEVSVPGWPASYLWHEATVARRANAAALLVPFDPLIWHRPRVERLFGMRYRIEIYVPPAQRVHGYYVLPFLFGEQLVARVDLKADRAGGALLVQSVHPEPGIPQSATVALAGQLRALAHWLGLADVVVMGTSSFAAVLRARLAD